MKINRALCWSAIATSAALTIALIGTALAAPDCTVVHCVSLPVVQHNPPPTIAPTPIPPELSTLVLQLSEMRSGYVRDTFRELTNADAAENYDDPNAALAAFQQQGRETSWYTILTSTDYLFSDAIAVSNQVIRYATTDGAFQGFQFGFGRAQQNHPDYRPFHVNAPCCPVGGLRRTFTDDGVTYDQFFILAQSGRYVSDVQVIGLAGSVSVERAVAYANIPLSRILNTPQAVRSDALSSPHIQQAPDVVTIPYSVFTLH